MCGDALVDVAKVAAKVAIAAAKVVKVAKDHQRVHHTRWRGGSPRRKQPSQAADHPSAAVGGLRADLARGARDVDDELRWRRARLRRGVRGPGRLSRQRERRQKRARGAGEAGRGTHEGVDRVREEWGDACRVCARGPTCRQRGASSRSMTTHDEAAEKFRAIESKVVRQALVLVAQPPPLRRYRMRLSENCARKDELCT